MARGGGRSGRARRAGDAAYENDASSQHDVAPCPMKDSSSALDHKALLAVASPARRRRPAQGQSSDAATLEKQVDAPALGNGADAWVAPVPLEQPVEHQALLGTSPQPQPLATQPATSQPVVLGSTCSYRDHLRNRGSQAMQRTDLWRSYMQHGMQLGPHGDAMPMQPVLASAPACAGACGYCGGIGCEFCGGLGGGLVGPCMQGEMLTMGLPPASPQVSQMQPMTPAMMQQQNPNQAVGMVWQPQPVQQMQPQQISQEEVMQSLHLPMGGELICSSVPAYCGSPTDMALRAPAPTPHADQNLMGLAMNSAFFPGLDCNQIAEQLRLAALETYDD